MMLVHVFTQTQLPQPPIQQCIINYFTASPNQIIQGAGSTLTWSTTGCKLVHKYIQMLVM